MIGLWLRFYLDFRGQATVGSRRPTGRRDRLRGILLLRAVCCSLGGVGLTACRTSFWGGPAFGELSGGNWMASERSPPHGGRPMFQAGQGSTVRGSLSLLGYIATSVPFAPRPFGG
jgi:hypothetical protein